MDLHRPWAKGGGERYPCIDRLAQRVDTALHDAAEPAIGPVARAARLVLDFVLTRAGLCLRDAVGILFRLPVAADDHQFRAHLLRLLTLAVVRPIAP